MQQGNIFGMSRDSVGGTFIVALCLCLTCAFLVSLTSVSLRSIQMVNQETFRKSKVLEVAQISRDEIREAGGVLAAFDKRIRSLIINLDTGEEALEELTAALEEVGKDLGGDVLGRYDQFWAAKTRNPLLADPIPDRRQDIAGLRFRERFSHVHILMSEDGETPERLIFPIRGNGLWGVMQGFVALEPDLKTVAGLTYFDHKETPGLGGEVDNAEWKESWVGKRLFDDDRQVALSVIKGPADSDAKFEIDGLSGATITGNGVNSMLQFWFGSRGFQSFIEDKAPSLLQVAGNAIDTLNSDTSSSLSVNTDPGLGVHNVR